MGTLNFYPKQYQDDNHQTIRHNYLPEQFSDPSLILKDIEQLVAQGDFTLGRRVDDFERAFSDRVGCDFGIGVGSGTDALFLSLTAAGVGPGMEVITTPYTFYATVAAIVRTGAKPVFVDIDDTHNLDVHQIEAAITRSTKAILPVHWSGRPCSMQTIQTIAKQYNLVTIADACHAIDSSYKGTLIGRWADLSCFSLHPLKNLNVWGDGGVVVTDRPDYAERICRLRNHGLSGRDTCEEFAYNSRLDTLQAIVGLHLLKHQLHITTQKRKANAAYLNDTFNSISQITLPPEQSDRTSVYHLYMAKFERRDCLKRFLNDHGIDAKIHYPTPIHLQPAARFLGHGPGSFPNAEALADQCLSLPVHEFVTEYALDKMIELICEFYHEA